MTGLISSFGLQDYIALAVILLAVIAAVWYMKKRGKKGCGGCSGCDGCMYKDKCESKDKKEDGK
ncbi:MAG: FeoB-associated Cys-rich membrane protein [Oscillospiraceae bacterium]|nr:FeoB-associated Cys-rich membrane protein [Oscillospiraceae bacterium]